MALCDEPKMSNFLGNFRETFDGSLYKLLRIIGFRLFVQILAIDTWDSTM